MSTPASPDSSRPESDKALAEEDAARYVIRLYVAGATPNSTRAIANLRALCDEHLAGHYSLEVVDIYQSPSLALEGRIVAAPTLVRCAPLPERRVVGDLSDPDELFAALDIRGN